MLFNRHSDLVGKHAFLSPSKYHWVNYDAEKFDRVYMTQLAAVKGTALHDFASNAIALGIKLPRTAQTLNSYVNDAIGFKMTPEQSLRYSTNSFGTADAISFRNDLLRIHDLKTGVIKSSMHQLEVYAALFCLEYGYRPGDIQIELRIYQNDEIAIHIPEAETIAYIMDRIVTFDRRINELRAEALG